MPIFGPAIRIATTVARGIARYNKYESKLFDSAYRGFPRSVRRGARHGYLAGTISGTLINKDDVGTNGGFQKPSNELPSSGQKYKTRSGYKGSHNRRFSKYYRRDNYCPRPSSWNTKRSRNW